MKTVTKPSANDQKRDISNFIEHATLQYMTSSEYVSDEEMDEVHSDTELVNELKNGIEEVQNKEYTIV